MEGNRLANLRRLMKQCGGTTKFAERLGYANPAFVSQMGGPNPSRKISERTARGAEAALKLPAGWMDRDHGDESPIGAAPAHQHLINIMRAAADAATDAQLEISPAKFTNLVTIIFEHLGHAKAIDANYIKNVVGLMRRD